ncbi:hypothetical protein K5549_009599 [Capra hircus]|nr:hypothetical protein K5549_009599 [Capra hircus]
MELEEGTPLWQLQKLPTEQGLQLLHKIIDGICGLTYPLYQDYHSVRDSAEGMRVLEDITTFFKAVVGKNLSDEEISQQSNQLNSSHQEAIMKRLKVGKMESSRLCWKKYLHFLVTRLKNGEVKPYSVEMSKEELKNLINSWEAANKVVLQLK